jgi:hypothetical protein
MTICYREGDPLPENGWVVICKPLEQFALARDLETLTWIVGTFEDEAYRKAPDVKNPVEVYEVGRELSHELEIVMATLRKRS